MGRDHEPDGQQALAAPADARPISDEMAEGAAGGGFLEFLDMWAKSGAGLPVGPILRPGLIEPHVPQPADPVTPLQTVVQGGCPVQLSGTLPGKDR